MYCLTLRNMILSYRLMFQVILYKSKKYMSIKYTEYACVLKMIECGQVGLLDTKTLQLPKVNKELKIICKSRKAV